MKSITDLHRLRDFAEAYETYMKPENGGAPTAAAVVLADMAANLLGVDYCSELEAFTTAQAMLKGALADEDKPMVERLLTNAAIRFARKLALLPPTEKT